MLDRSSNGSSTTRALLERCYNAGLVKTFATFSCILNPTYFFLRSPYIYKVPSPRHLGRGTVSPTQRLVTPSTHSMLSYCFDVNESA